MPRLQVYLPDELHRKLKRLRLSPSELLQNAVREEIERRARLAELDRYLSDLRSEVGEPPAVERSRARATARRITRHLRRGRAA